MKPVLVLCGVSGLSILALLSACGGASEADVTAPPTDTDAAAADGSSEASSGATSGNLPDMDAGTIPGDTAFTGAPAYVPTTGRNTLKPGEHPGNGNPSKLACLMCHGAGGNAPRWFAAGSVFKDVAGTQPAAQVEIRLLDPSGKSVSTYSDNLGNFVISASTATKAGVTFPLHAGARDATNTKLMSMGAPNGDCNNTSCHGGSQGWIHVP